VEKKPRRRRRYLLVALGLLVVIGVLGGIKYRQIATLIGFGETMQAAGPPPESVGSAVATAHAWETTLSAVGSITGVESVAVATEMPGTVTRIGFQSGDLVRKSQLLVELEAKAETAQLAGAIARRDRARLTAERARKLIASSAIPRSELDDAEAQLAAASSEVDALRAQLGNKQVRAPFAGRTGIRAVNVGDYVAAGSRVTTVDAVGGVFVDFTLPQDQLGAVRVGSPVRIAATTMRDPEQPAGATFEGKITAIDPGLDPATRSIKLRATVPEHGGALRPGMFVAVTVVLPERKDVVVVPVTAVVHAAYGNSVFGIEPKPLGSPGITKTPDGKPVMVARHRFVRLGSMHGDFVAITEGVKAGEKVVSEGAFKLRNGVPIVIDDRVKPRSELDPKPENR
jgi:membrane fusion protein (multidrug efflux system)